MHLRTDENQENPHNSHETKEAYWNENAPRTRYATNRSFVTTMELDKYPTIHKYTLHERTTAPAVKQVQITVSHYSSDDLDALTAVYAAQKSRPNWMDVR